MSERATGDLNLAAVAVILLGSDEYPGAPELANPRFRATHDGVLRYFSDARGLGIPADRVLNLFSSDLNATSQAEKLHEFIEGLRRRSSNAWTLFVHYVGHGDTFASRSGEYYLTIRLTRKNLESDTSLSFATVARAVAVLPGTRVLIIDACFAASATRFLQTSAKTHQRHATKMMIGATEGPNTILLAAASKDSFAEAPEGLSDLEYREDVLAARLQCAGDSRKSASPDVDGLHMRDSGGPSPFAGPRSGNQGQRATFDVRIRAESSSLHQPT